MADQPSEDLTSKTDTMTRTKPTLRYWICATPRTGGSLLSQWLGATGVAGHPAEYFWRDNEPAFQEHWHVSSYAGYLDRALHHGTTPNGVFGAKLDAGGYLEHFESRLRTIPQFSDPDLSFQAIITSAFPNLKFIWITRRNKVRQAVSWWKAVQTNEWGRRQGNSPRAGQEPVYNFAAIDQLTNESLMREAGWQAHFSEWQARPLTIVYEDFVDHYVETVAQVLDFLGITEPYTIREHEITLVRQADGLSEEWVQRYRREKQLDWTMKGW